MKEKNEMIWLYILSGLALLWGGITIVWVLVEIVKEIIKR